MSVEFPLLRQLIAARDTSADELLNRFLAYVQEKKLTLYETQEEAILELLEGANVILNTPTGSGKSLVAAALHFVALARGRRSVYTCPIKALVNEKFLALCREFGPENVGMATGDATVNRDAPILCCTAEILANLALREGPEAKVADVIMDEFHYYSDKERGVAWQVPLLTLNKTRFLLMSATLGDTSLFETELTRLNKLPTKVVKAVKRPVPLEYEYTDVPLEQTVEKLVTEKKAPVYVVHFTQMECAETAQNLTSINICSREEKSVIASALEGFRFNSPYGPDLKKYLRHGIGLHHAGLLPKYRVLVEQLAQKGLLKVICGTDTLGVGVNVPIRTVLLTKLSKYGGEKVAILTSRDFHQVTGRAGRKGFDDIGWVLALAPEHMIENARLERKAAANPEKSKKLVKKKPPEGFVNWSKETFFKLVNSSPEPLVSQFQVGHGMLLNVLSRPGDGCRAMQRLIRDSHETPQRKKEHRARAWQLFRALAERKIIDLGSRSGDGIKVNVELQDNFSLDETLALYVIDTLKLINPESENYALDVLTLVESIVENPEIILRRQLDRVKSAKLAELKMDGVQFEERMLELEKLEYPKPNRDFVYSTFNEFAARHPWVGQENIRPKSIAREMFENFYTFADYIREYELQKVEGVLLRYLVNVHHVLRHTVPESAKLEPLKDVEAWVQVMVRQVDSSLLEEWEKMRDPAFAEKLAKNPEVLSEKIPPPDITRSKRSFLGLVRTEIFAFLRGLASRNYEAALEILEEKNDANGEAWSVGRFGAAMLAYYKDHERVSLDNEARNARHTYLEEKSPGEWLVQQTLVDPEGLNDWSADFRIDLVKSRESGTVVLSLEKLGEISR